MKRISLRVLLACLLSFHWCVNAETESFFVGHFSQEGIGQWQEKSFKDHTHYTLVTAQDKLSVVKAHSQHSASGLFRKIRIDLQQYPFMNWRWKIARALQTGDETVKAGDDYAARIYVVVDGGWLAWRTKALNYVWAGEAEKGAVWPNAFAGKRAQMFAIRNHSDATGVWYTEKRNVLQDLQQVHKETIRYIDVVAIMTDTDNSGGEVTAYYGDIFFSSQ